VLRVEQLDVAYDRTQVLFGVDLTVTSDGLVCLMGRNGVGKTTLLNACMGVLKPTAGRVFFQDTDITDLSPSKRVRLGMAYVPQGREGFPHLTVKENLEVVLASTAHKQRAAIDDALDLFPRLTPLLGRNAGFLSGGQQQQLAIARALITRPELMLLDEPTEGIQPSIILEIEAAIAQLNSSTSMAILLVEQYLEFALRLADRFAVMDAGEIVHEGATADLQGDSMRELLAI